MEDWERCINKGFSSPSPYLIFSNIANFRQAYIFSQKNINLLHRCCTDSETEIPTKTKTKHISIVCIIYIPNRFLQTENMFTELPGHCSQTAASDFDTLLVIDDWVMLICVNGR